MSSDTPARIHFLAHLEGRFQLNEPMHMTVLICSYNRAESLRETLESVNACRMPTGCNVSIMVVNNNSTDQTAQVCEEFSLRSRMPFRTVMETSPGLSVARNRGLRESVGTVVIFTDDDVLVREDWLELYAREFQGGGTACVFGRIVPDWRDHKPPWFTRGLSPAYALLDYGESRIAVNTREYEFFGANFALRREDINSMGGFDTRLGRTQKRLHIGEETRVFLELLERGALIIYQPLIVVRHVIEASRKEKAYMLRYYRDTADSMVHLSLSTARRKILGIPTSRGRELVRFFALLPIAIVSVAVRRDRPGLFLIRLQLIRYTRMLRLFLGVWWSSLGTVGQQDKSANAAPGLTEDGQDG